MPNHAHADTPIVWDPERGVFLLNARRNAAPPARRDALIDAHDVRAPRRLPRAPLRNRLPLINEGVVLGAVAILAVLGGFVWLLLS